MRLVFLFILFLTLGFGQKSLAIVTSPCAKTVTLATFHPAIQLANQAPKSDHFEPEPIGNVATYALAFVGAIIFNIGIGNTNALKPLGALLADTPFAISRRMDAGSIRSELGDIYRATRLRSVANGPFTIRDPIMIVKMNEWENRGKDEADGSIQFAVQVPKEDEAVFLSVAREEEIAFVSTSESSDNLYYALVIPAENAKDALKIMRALVARLKKAASTRVRNKHPFSLLPPPAFSAV